VPAADPKSNYLAHKDEIDAAVQRVLNSGTYILGKEVSAFEDEFASYLGGRSAIGVGSGTEALHVAVRACGIGAGDAVITVSHTANGTVSAIELAGASPILVDIDPDTFNLDPNRLEELIRDNHKGINKTGAAPIKAIIPVHLYGRPADLPAILEIAERYSLYVIEDCAQSVGASLDGRRTGTWGDISAFSFYPTKNLGAMGDGGAVVTNDPGLAAKARALREYGWRDRYISESRGLNSRLDEMQAAILRVKLKYLDEENALRRRMARLYDSELSATGVVLPKSCGPAVHVYHQYVIRSQLRDDLRTFLAGRLIGSLVHYPVPVHMQPAYQGSIMSAATELPNTERICREILSLPMYAQICEEDVRLVARTVSEWAKQG
jgi:dTDP-4-amino-4,6-dideoxygalactose transaminase